MLFFEDFMELIDGLPYDARRNLTTIRTLDLSVQNRIEPLDQKIENFFSRYRQSGLDSQQKQKLHDEIMSDFEKALKESDEKVELSKQLNDTMMKVMKKLELELSKFRCELEADNAGITEMIERRVKEQEKSAAQNLRLERKRSRQMRLNGSNRTGLGSLGASGTSGSASGLSLTVNGASSGHSATDLLSGANEDALMTSVALPLVSQANSPLSGGNVMLGGPSASTTTPRRHNAASRLSESSSGSRPPKKKLKICPSLTPSEDGDQILDEDGALIDPGHGEEVWELGGGDSDDAVYCVCRDISHGVMVACDKSDCEIEWFHCRCVGLTVPPKGKWYCPQCRDGNNASRPKKTRR